MTIVAETFEYAAEVDIGNRALQHLGIPRMSTLQDNTKEANAILFCYDKLRQAELRRNPWKFAARTTIIKPLDTNSLILTPPTWLPATLYQFNSVVSYSGIYWANTLQVNTGREPGVDQSWVPYFGSLQAEMYDTTGGTGYFTGDLVYYPTPSILNQDYYKLFTARNNFPENVANPSATDPTTIAVWSSTTPYNPGDIATVSGTAYISLVPNNLNLAPNTNSTESAWLVGTTYAAAAVVVDVATGILYTSQVNSNTVNYPGTDSGANWLPQSSSPYYQPWLTWTTQQQGINWAAQPAGFDLLSANIIWPIGSGPIGQSPFRNAFRLPNGFLRVLPQKPKEGIVSYLGSPGGIQANDWEFDGKHLVTAYGDPIPFRFIADVTNVADFDPMFCEGLACRIAYETCEEITQSGDKMGRISKAYDVFMREARMTNCIETGSTMPPQDNYISCRL